ncbi:MAG: stage II sporulation protein M [Chloroflexi bacterium]|nr:stage II sporulation protein M [Chloroflexota bacterium]
MFWGAYNVLWWVIAGLLLVDVLLIRMGVHLFNREELLGRDIDELNLLAAWRTLRREFLGAVDVGSHKGVPYRFVDWYRFEVAGALRRIAIPCLFMALALAAGMIVGAVEARAFPLPANAIPLNEITNDFTDRLTRFGLFSANGVLFVVLQNLRAVALATLLGIFSFGVMAVVALMLPLGLAGYFAASAGASGYSPWLFLAAFVVPHGILEIPAAILIGGAILRLGASVVAPPPNKSLSEAWLAALADWLKIGLGLVLPMLVGAALVEVLITPRIVLAVFGD